MATESRVLGTSNAVRAAQEMHALLNTVQGSVRELIAAGQRLSDPRVWDSPSATRFRQADWPRASGSLQRLTASCDTLSQHASRVVQDIMTAGSHGTLSTTAGAGAAGLTPTGVPPDPEAYYKQVAYQEAGIDPATWVPSRGLLANDHNARAAWTYYQHLYDRNHNLRWAGMGKLAGASIYAGMQDLYVMSQLPRDQLLRLALSTDPVVSVAAEFALAVGGEELTYFDDQFLKMQKLIFDDLAWQHAAYLDGGMAAITASYQKGELTRQEYQDWLDINSGDPARVQRGNTQLLYHEQHDIIQPTYDQIRSRNVVEGRLFTDFLSMNARSPIPGGKPFRDVVGTNIDLIDIGPIHVGWETADVTNFNDRWQWITKDMMPAYQNLLQNPQAAQQAIDQPVADRAKQYRELPWLHVDGY